MATKVVMEALSPTMEEGRLVKWTKNEGDAVKSGEILAEVETDKAVMELVARGDGVLRKRLINEGDTAPVGQLIAIVAAADENIDELAGGAPAAAEAPPKAGDAPPKDAAPDEKASAQEGAPAKPPADAAKAAPAREDAPAQSPADRVADGRTSVPEDPSHSQGEASMPPQERDRRGAERFATDSRGAAVGGGRAEPGDRVRSSPLARKLASDRGVELDGVQGSGPGGRIVKRDIEQAATQPQRGAAAAGAQRAAVPVAERKISTEGDYQDIPLTQIRKTIARRLAESIGPVPTFYLTAELDVERVAEMREAMIELGDQYKVSFNDIVLKAAATALQQHPEVNAHWLGDKMRYFNRVHVGMAVAVEDGLITPVIFDADRKGLADISREARELAKRARDRKLKPEEYTGATFSVSNLGMFGIEHFTAIINPPEAAILAIGGVEERVVAVDGAPAIRKRMTVTMSCDHRVIDGATGAKFLQTLRRLIENPLMLVY
ncbi:MAG TPA: pyruvate dehydrogenase complex dihydrolipoamide acetyltransferase [Vicinamibacterales bacterium]|nr:pyruvate dehydrogenase complex dihydrolipoamide acetyltransferase [Vicinamibacterales bacterium]